MFKKVVEKIKKKVTREKLFDAIFLSVLCIVYSIVAFTNLGDDVAPQTFYRLNEDAKLAIVLDEPVKSPKVVFYTGITKNDFDLSYQAVRNCGCNKETLLGGISEEQLSTSLTKNIDGPFRWKNISVSGEVSAIIINNNLSGRFIDFGEMAVFSEEGQTYSTDE